MQKISTYLYTNRINVVADLALFPVRYRIVYQNRIKIYKGIDNILTIDVKNSEQKRIDILNMNFRMSITDINGQEITTVLLVNSSTQGLATATITANMLEQLDPQFLNFSIYKLNNDNTKTVMYADTNFGVVGNMELLAGAIPTTIPPIYITRFNPLTNADTSPFTEVFYSDAAEILRPNFITAEINETISFEFQTSFLSANVTVEFTKDTVIGSSTTWEEIETLSIPENSSITNRIYTYPTINRSYTWARVKYVKQNSSTGSFKQVIIRF